MIESDEYKNKYKVNEYHEEPESKYGVIYGGAVEGNFFEALRTYNERVSWLKIGLVHPLPEDLIRAFLENRNLEKILVLEELDPFIETEVYRIAYL